VELANSDAFGQVASDCFRYERGVETRVDNVQTDAPLAGNGTAL